MSAMRLVLLWLVELGSAAWTQVATSSGMFPAGPYGAVVVYVPKSNQLFLMGDSGYTHATFALRGSSWVGNNNMLGLFSMPGRERLAGAAPDDLPEVWLHGGRLRPQYGFSEWEYRTDLWRYDLQEDDWDEIRQYGSEPPEQFSWGHGMVWTKSNQEMWLYGGSGDVWSFKLPTGAHYITWTKRLWQGPAHVYRKYFVLFWHDANQELYVHGGIDSATDPLGELWKYRMSDSTWLVVNNHTAGPPSGPMARGYHVGGWREDDEELYIHGGRGWNNVVLNDLWRYTLSTDTWLLLSDTGPARQYHVGVWIPAKLELWMVGGWDGVDPAVDADDTWKYTVSECGTFVCPSNYILKDNAVDIKAFNADECCNLNTTTSTTGTSTSTAVTHTMTSVTATSITATSSTMSTLSTTTSTTSGLLEINGAEAMRMTTLGLITLTLLS